SPDICHVTPAGSTSVRTTPSIWKGCVVRTILNAATSPSLIVASVTSLLPWSATLTTEILSCVPSTAVATPLATSKLIISTIDSVRTANEAPPRNAERREDSNTGIPSISFVEIAGGQQSPRAHTSAIRDLAASGRPHGMADGLRGR